MAGEVKAAWAPQLPGFALAPRRWRQIRLDGFKDGFAPSVRPEA